jgi:hypothetical protein
MSLRSARGDTQYTYKVNIPMYAGGFKQVLYKEYIFWIQVKIHISDQTSLRICNSVEKATYVTTLLLRFTLIAVTPA